MGLEVGSKSVTRRELLAKSLIYRAWTMMWECLLATILIYLDLVNIYLYILIVNLIKIGVYFAYDLGWFNYIHRPGLLKKVKRWLGVARC